jgi:hypothetical protein
MEGEGGERGGVAWALVEAVWWVEADPAGVGYVELDSCTRAVATNGGFGIATDALVQQINTLLQDTQLSAPPT